MLLAVLQAVFAAQGRLSLHLLFGFALMTGLVAAFDAPASGALGARLVPYDDLPNALALGGMANSLARIIGMAAAGLIVAFAGVPTAFLLNSLSFAPVLLVLLRLNPPERAPSRARPLASLRDGVEYVRGSYVITATLALAVVLGTLGRSYQVTMAIMVTEVFHRQEATYAILSAAFAAGALLGGVLAARLRDVVLGTVVTAGLAGAGLQVAAGLAPSLWVFAAILVPVAAAAVMFDTAVTATVQMSTPPELRGRVIAVAATAAAVAGPLGPVALGAAADTLGVRVTYVGAGLACAAAALIVGARFDALPGRIGRRREAIAA
jgi:MFS family permease